MPRSRSYSRGSSVSSSFSGSSYSSHSSYSSGDSSYSSSYSSYSSYSSSSSRRRRSGRHRAGEKRGRDRDDSRDRRRGDSRDRRRSGENDRKRRFPDRPPNGIYCQACKKQHHWTIECKLVRDDPDRYPNINIHDGCPICGKVGHEYTRCDSLKYPCKSCGDMHATRECPYEYTPVEYHEFFDEAKGYPYYVCPSTNQTDWVFKGKRGLDTILWHCDACNILIKEDLEECVQCHKLRKRRVQAGGGKKKSHNAKDNNDDEGAAGEKDDVDEEGARREESGRRGKREKSRATDKSGAADKKKERNRDRAAEAPSDVILTDSYIGSWIDDTKTAAKILEQVADVKASGGCVQSALSEVIAAPNVASSGEGGGNGTFLTLTAEALRLLE